MKLLPDVLPVWIVSLIATGLVPDTYQTPAGWVIGAESAGRIILYSPRRYPTPGQARQTLLYGTWSPAPSRKEVRA